MRARGVSTRAGLPTDAPLLAGSRRSTTRAGSCVRCCARGAQTRMPITASACTRSWMLAGRTLLKLRRRSLHSSSRAWKRSWPRRGACTMFKGFACTRQTRSTVLTLLCLLQRRAGTGDDCTQRRGGAFQAGVHARRVCAQLRSAVGDGAQDRRRRDCSLGARLPDARALVNRSIARSHKQLRGVHLKTSRRSSPSMHVCVRWATNRWS